MREVASGRGIAMAQETERGDARTREQAAMPVDAAGLAAGDILLVDRPAAGTAKVIDPSGAKALKFAFSLNEAKVVILDVDVVLVFPDGGRLILPAFMMQMITAEPPRLTFSEQVIDPQAVIAAAGDVRLVDPLPQLAISDAARPPEKPPESPAAPPVVQMPAAQSFANTPAPRPRPFPSAESVGDGESLQESNSRFAKRINFEEIQGSSLKSEGSLTASTERVPVQQQVQQSQTVQPEQTPVDKEALAKGQQLLSGIAPQITSSGGGDFATGSIAENVKAVLTITATDPDTSTGLVYSIAGGDDANLFAINSQSGQLYFVNAPNFETPGSSLGTNAFKVKVAVSDGLKTDEQTLTINVVNANEAPTDALLSVNTVSENVANGTLVGVVTGVDPDAGGSHSYGFAPGGDAGGRFAINPTTGAITVANGALLDHENSAQHLIVVRVTDQGGLSFDKSLFINIANANDAPSIISNGGGTSAVTAISENVSLVTTVVATDPDVGATLSYSIVGGVDQALFTINPTTGALSFVTPPDFEAPADADGNNVYEVIVQASDGSLTDTQSISVTVNAANDPPVITSDGGGNTAALTAAENSTATITTVVASDVDPGASISYAIVGGADAALFTINPLTGALRFLNPAQDFEAPNDANADGVYDVIVQAQDGQGGFDSQTLAITLTNVNDAPVITSDGGGNTANVNVAEAGALAVTTVVATDQDAGASISFAITGGLDAGLFTINPTTGQLSFLAQPDFEAPGDSNGDNIYEVVVTANDGLGGTDSQTILVSVGDQNDAPAITYGGGGPSAATSMAENGTLVGTVTANDPDLGETLTFNIIGGADAALFTINPTTGALSFNAPPNFEAAGDAGGNNVYDVIVEVSDGTLTDTQSIAVTVTNQNEAPSITSNGGGASAATSVVENTTAVTTVTASDPDAGASFTYSIVGGADQALFTINPTTGALSFISAPDSETPTDVGGDNIYDVRVQVSDGLGGIDTQDIAVTVTDANDPPVITSDGGGVTATVNINENLSAVTTVVATDPELDAITYSIVGGADTIHFTINPTTGALAFLAPPDFDSPTDSNGDNQYQVIVRATDTSLNFDDQTITVVVGNVNDSAPVITSNGGGVTAAISQAEGGTAVTTVMATDADPGASLTYSITGGADQGLFTINPTTGVLQFNAPPNFETPTDSGGDNVYDVQVQVSDGTHVDTQDIAVTITNQNEAPAITSDGGGPSAALSQVENGTAVTTVTASDPDAGASLSFAIVGGADQALFTINPTTGVLQFSAPPNFEAPGDAGGNNVYDVVVRVSDGLGGTDDQAIAVTVTNQNETPAITSNGGGPSAAVSIGENGTAVTTVIAADPDAGASLTYSLVGGADQGLFTINPTTGALTFQSAPNFEAPGDAGGDNVYDVRVRVSDGLGGIDEQDIAVTVTNVNEAPAITSNGGGTTAAISIAENGTAVTTVAASDPDAGASLSFSVVGGTDQTRFTVNPTTGVLTFNAPPDFENPTDSNTNNVYQVIVRVSDGLGGSDDQTINVTVTDINDNAPVITSNGGGNTASIAINENSTAVTTVTSTDADAGASRTFSISGGADAGRFTINPTTGVLTFTSAPDFENPTDAGANNVYDVQVQISDGTFTDTQDIAVTVNNISGNQIGDASDNTLIGTSEEDTIQGLDGNDIIDGGLGNDSLFGGDGDDVLSGGAGNDYLDGGNGSDSIYSGTGYAFIYAGDGNDRMYIDATALNNPLTWVEGGNGFDDVSITGAGSISGNDLMMSFTQIEKFDFTAPSVVANLTNFDSTNLANILGASGPGNTLTFDFDGNDSFSVASGEHYTQVGNLYTFYSDAGLTMEIGRVSII